MSQIKFIAPDKGTNPKLNTKVSFEVECSDDIDRVAFIANPNIPIGTVDVNNGKAKLSRSFSKSGNRTILARGIRSEDGAVLAVAKITLEIGDGKDLKLASDGTLAAIAGAARMLLDAGNASVEPAVRAYAANFSDWCVSFCAYTYFRATGKDPNWGVEGFNVARGRFENWVPDMALWAQESGFWLREKDIHLKSKSGKVLNHGTPKPGYLIVYGDLVQIFGGSSRQNYPHIGVVVDVDGDLLTTIEGNAGVPGQVRKRTPRRSKLPNHAPGAQLERYIAGYIIPPMP